MNDLERFKRVLRADPCAYCGGPGGTVDHIVSSAVRGYLGLPRDADETENLTGACRSCNASKQSKSLLAFLLKAPIGTNHWLLDRERADRWHREHGFMS